MRTALIKDTPLALSNQSMSVGGNAQFAGERIGLVSSALDVAMTLTLDAGATLFLDQPSIVSATTVVIQPGASVTGNGTIVADTVIDKGTTKPGSSPRKLTVDGRYDQDPEGTLVLEIGGTIPVVDHDVFIVTDDAIFQGRINLQFIGGYLPEAGDSIDAIQGGGTLDVSDATILIDGLCEDLVAQFDPATGTVTVALAVIPVSIDVKPDSATNPINLASKGVIPVTLFGTADFDVTQVDVTTVQVAGAAPDHGGHFEDVNDDGILDLVAHFRVQETELLDAYFALLSDDLADGILDSNRQLFDLQLTGQLLDGTRFEGSDAVDLFLSGKRLKVALKSIGSQEISTDESSRHTRGGVSRP